MNWTSGQLNRSTKANRDPIRKRQKQSFARQRAGGGNPSRSPLSLAHFHNDLKVVDSGRPITSHHFTSAKHATHQINSTESSVPTAGADNEHLARNPLEHVRRRLLKSKDWTGVSIARPAAIAFRSAEEMDQMGRRRRVSKKAVDNAPRTSKDRTKPHNTEKLRAMQQGRRASIVSDLADVDCSIRVGSKIHQSQTTEEAPPSHEIISQKSNEASKPLVKLTPQRKYSQVLYLEPDLHEEPGQPLLPLEQARSLKSFDEVQQRSSSLVRQMSSSSNPFFPKCTPEGDPNGHHSRPIAQPPVASHHPDVQRTIPRLLDRYKTNGSLQSSARQYQQPKADSRAESEDRSGEAESGSVLSNASVSVQHAPSLLKPRFTIDHQVLLQQQMENGQTEPSDNAGSEGILHNIVERPSFEPAVDSPLPQQPPHQHDSGMPETSSMFDEEPPNKKRKLEASADDHGLSSSHFPAPSTDHQSKQSSVSTSSVAPFNLRTRFLQAKQHHLESLASSPPLRHTPSEGHRNIGEENEAWMKYVFPKDFDRISQTFNFSSPAPQGRNRLQESYGSPSVSHRPSFDARFDRHQQHHMQSMQPPSTINPSAVNTTLHHEQITFPGRSVPSETDFVSRYSPMQGAIDDALGSISLYGNPAHSVRSFIPEPSVAAAFQRSSNSASIRLGYQATYQRLPTTPTHREPLQPLSQPRLWSGDKEDSVYNTGSDSLPTPPHQHHSLTPLWTGAKAAEQITDNHPTHPNRHGQTQGKNGRPQMPFYQQYSANKSTPSLRTTFGVVGTLPVAEQQTSGYWK